MDTIQSNKTIALFMGWNEDEIQAEDWCGCNVLDDVFSGLKEMRHYAPNERWDDLMPVIEKIEAIGMTMVDIYKLHCRIQPVFYNISKDAMEWQLLHEERGKTKIEATYKTVLSFINWYNAQTH